MKNPVEVLKQAGYEVYFEHWRPQMIVGDSGQGEVRRYMRGVTKWQPTAHGGVTFCIVSVGGLMVAKTVHGHNGRPFCYRLGRLISAGRARKLLLNKR